MRSDIHIARLRMKHEPPESGWGYPHGLYYSGDIVTTLRTLYPGQSGCVNDFDGEPDGLHLPGRWCTYDGGFNGWKIGAGEMKGMRHPRYIIQKPTNRNVKDEDQEDYERAKPGILAKVRFRIDTFLPQNYGPIEHSDENPVGVPVHDACWKIFERVSKSKLGSVDLQGFMALWHRQACGTCGFAGIDQDPMIQKCKEMFWKHLPGTEPAGESVFREISSPGENKTDPFRLLPAELKTMIRSDLSSQGIASLRLVLRSFRYLPKQLFLQLIEKEMPWFWEFDELEAFMERARADYSRVIGYIEIKDNRINWYVLYKQLSLARGRLLGLRNRVRVWNVAEEIAERIKHLRDDLGEGKDLSLLPTEKEEEHENRIKQCGFSYFKYNRTLGPHRM
ncbi:hypothetical protein BKA61DRAFT_742527 [Leptodontidium sp. MPI-SDFR-AT-0119]|nr:hypothetical protein BKA61DRAFT_742527 [Leptodontidium sp. MPI-SDFR-AT-0119]